jgi:2'-5' RNA ligase
VARCFIAIELDRSVLEALDRLQAKLRREVPDGVVRWVAGSGIHLTLKFLGDVPLGQVRDIEDGIVRACRSYVPFALTCSGIGCFPNPRRPRVVWVGVEASGGVLSKLQQTVEREVAPLGYPTEKREFTPHLTLGRAQRRASSDELRRLGELISSAKVGPIAEMEVSEVSLIRSDLRPTGAVYTPLAQVPLGRMP